MNKKENNKTEKAKETLSNFWQKTTDISKKAAEGAKAIAEQTKKNIHESQAKKYTPVIESEFFNADFRLPNIIKIVDDSANRNFIICEGAIGWIEKHEDVDVLHMYAEFVAKCGISFIPISQIDNVYCKDHFDVRKFINSNQFFEKTTEEKIAELEHIAYNLGAKSFSVEIVETDYSDNTKNLSINANVSLGGGISSSKGRMQSGKNTTFFGGGKSPEMPTLKWFAHDDNIKRLVQMRLEDSNSVQSKVLEIRGSSTVTMSKSIAGAIDDLCGIKGGISMINETIKQYNSVLIFEIEF